MMFHLLMKHGVQGLKAEVNFLIAYYYHNLVRTHGGVPIVTRTYSLNE
jgi:hypothetical protein